MGPMRHALQTFMILYPSIVACLEGICHEGSSEWSADSLTDARGLLLTITTTDFLSALVITNSCISYLTALTSNLQAEAKDIIGATSEMDSVQTTLQSVRDNIDTHTMMNIKYDCITLYLSILILNYRFPYS